MLGLVFFQSTARGTMAPVAWLGCWILGPGFRL